MRDTTGTEDYARVVRNALQLYEYMIEEIDAGNKIYSSNDGINMRELELFKLEGAE